jgi:RNA polymerase sigma-70 factor, ECF subfamily
VPTVNPDLVEPPLVSSPDAELLSRLRDGDESAFEHIVVAWSPTMLRMARSFVSTQPSAEEVVQETWLAVIRGLDAFEGRSLLRTWVLGILHNIARTRGAREARSVPWSSIASDDEAALDPSRFEAAGGPWGRHWTDDGAPRPWQPSPDAIVIAGEIRQLLAAALARLPEQQRTVVSMRDVSGLSSDEVCDALGISAANQRVLLHRGRTKLRAELEHYYHGHDSRGG